MDIERLIEELKREAAVKAEPYDSGGTLEWEAIDALTTMQAREAALIRALEGMVAFGEEMEREHLVGDEGCFWPVELARDALLNFRNEALGSSGLAKEPTC